LNWSGLVLSGPPVKHGKFSQLFSLPLKKIALKLLLRPGNRGRFASHATSLAGWMQGHEKDGKESKKYNGEGLMERQSQINGNQPGGIWSKIRHGGQRKRGSTGKLIFIVAVVTLKEVGVWEGGKGCSERRTHHHDGTTNTQLFRS